MVDPIISELQSVIEFLGTGDCYDAPSHISSVFLVAIESKISIVNIVCCLLTSMKVCACNAVRKDGEGGSMRSLYWAWIHHCV